MSEIYTHNGPAHRDEFLACCVLMARGQQQVVRTSDPEVIATCLTMPSIWVVDIGLKHEPSMRNFDHHQLPGDAPATCALSLVLEHVTKIKAEELRELLPWLEFTETLDSKGPRVAAKLVGVEGTAFYKFFMTMSPIESVLLQIFSKRSLIHAGDELGAIMHTIGETILKGIDELKKRLERLPEMCVFYPIKDLMVVNLAHIHFNDKPLIGLDNYLNKHWPDTAITVTQHERNPGCLCVFRRNDHPSVDFRRIKDKPGVIFAHANGFMAIIDPAVLHLNDAIEQSIA